MNSGSVFGLQEHSWAWPTACGASYFESRDCDDDPSKFDAPLCIKQGQFDWGDCANINNTYTIPPNPAENEKSGPCSYQCNSQKDFSCANRPSGGGAFTCPSNFDCQQTFTCYGGYNCSVYSCATEFRCSGGGLLAYSCDHGFHCTEINSCGEGVDVSIPESFTCHANGGNPETPDFSCGHLDEGHPPSGEFSCREFHFCKEDFTCYATNTCGESTQQDKFDCGEPDSTGSFLCLKQHDCTDRFQCFISHTCGNGYGELESDVFNCGDDSVDRDTFTCFNIFDCRDIFDCDDEFQCGSGAPLNRFDCGTGEENDRFTCGDAIEAEDTFICKAPGEFNCGNPEHDSFNCPPGTGLDYNCAHEYRCGNSDDQLGTVYDCTGVESFSCTDSFVCDDSVTSVFQCLSIASHIFNCNATFGCRHIFSCEGRSGEGDIVETYSCGAGVENFGCLFHQYDCNNQDNRGFRCINTYRCGFFHCPKSFRCIDEVNSLHFACRGEFSCGSYSSHDCWGFFSCQIDDFQCQVMGYRCQGQSFACDSGTGSTVPFNCSTISNSGEFQCENSGTFDFLCATADNNWEGQTYACSQGQFRCTTKHVFGCGWQDGQAFACTSFRCNPGEQCQQQLPYDCEAAHPFQCGSPSPVFQVPGDFSCSHAHSCTEAVECNSSGSSGPGHDFLCVSGEFSCGDSSKHIYSCTAQEVGRDVTCTGEDMVFGCNGVAGCFTADGWGHYCPDAAGGFTCGDILTEVNCDPQHTFACGTPQLPYDCPVQGEFLVPHPGQCEQPGHECPVNYGAPLKSSGNPPLSESAEAAFAVSRENRRVPYSRISLLALSELVSRRSQITREEAKVYLSQLLRKYFQLNHVDPDSDLLALGIDLEKLTTKLGYTEMWLLLKELRKP